MMDAERALELLGDPEQLEWHLRVRLLQLTDETSAVAIKAIELLLGMELRPETLMDLDDISVEELEHLRGIAQRWIRARASGESDLSSDR
jgi:hypothetical protein